MDDKQIVDLYWARSEIAISETEKKYGRYCHYIAYQILYNDEYDHRHGDRYDKRLVGGKAQTVIYALRNGVCMYGVDVEYQIQYGQECRQTDEVEQRSHENRQRDQTPFGSKCTGYDLQYIYIHSAKIQNNLLPAIFSVADRVLVTRFCLSRHGLHTIRNPPPWCIPSCAVVPNMSQPACGALPRVRRTCNRPPRRALP